MKIVIICFMLLFVCSCQNNFDNSVSDDSKKTNRPEENLEIVSENSNEQITRLDEVLKIWDDYARRDIQERYPDSKIIYVKDISEIDTEAYAREYSRYEIFIEDENPELRGPLTKDQVEQESLEGMDSDDPNIPFGHENDRWKEFSSQYKEGDEFYFYKSGPKNLGNVSDKEIYVLIRGNECLGDFISKLRI